MTTKEKIINKSIAKVSTEIAELEYLMEAKPISGIIEIRMEVKKLLENNKGDKRFEKDFIERIGQLADKEKECFSIAEKQRNWEENTDRLVELRSELEELKTELFYIESRKNKQ